MQSGQKREILRQLESDIASAKEGGKSWDEIRQEWGTPEQFVSEFNEDGRGIQKEKNLNWQRGSACFICLCGSRCLVCTLARKNGGQQLTKNVETQKIPDVVREAITDFRMMHMKNLSLGVMRKCRRHFLRKIGKMHKK